MSRPLFDSTHFGTNVTNRTTSPIDSISVGTKTPEPTPLKQPMELPEQNGKYHVPGERDPDPSSSDSSLNKSNSSKDSNSSKFVKKESDKNIFFVNTKNMTHWTHHQAILIHPTTVTTCASDVKKNPFGKGIQ